MLTEMSKPGIGDATLHTCRLVKKSFDLARDRHKVLEGAHLAVICDVNGARLVDVALDNV
jgi:hypothetical protein